MNLDKKELWLKFAKEFQSVWYSEILQIALYSHDCPTGKVIIILKEDSNNILLKSKDIIKSVLKKKLPMPLILSKKYIETSLDSFPLEFLNIVSDYENLIMNEDVLKDIFIDKSDVRLEMERELKGKWLHIKMAFLNQSGNYKKLIEVIKISMNSIFPILKGLIYLLDSEIPVKDLDIIKLADKKTDFSIDTFVLGFELLHNKTKMDKNEIIPFFTKFTLQLKNLMKFVDDLIILK
jgi:hypothetical protein